MLLPHMFNFIMAAGIIGVIAFQIWLTVSVFRSPAYERDQKIRQAQLIWLLPIIGATLVFSVLRESSASEQQTGATADRAGRGGTNTPPRATSRRTGGERS